MISEMTRKMEDIIAKGYNNVAGMVIMKDGSAVYEKYFGECDEHSRIHIFSATKSIVSVLMGIALDKGFIDSIDRRVLEFFPEYTLVRGERMLPEITIRDMLTMTVPYKFKFNPYTKYFTSSDWVKFSLDMMGGKGRIGEFRYAPIVGPDVLSGILAAATGKPLFDFARENLFEPLDITVEKSITFANKEEQMQFYKATDMSVWVADPMGVNTAGWGLTLSPMDMAKIGQLMLNGGMWKGQCLVSEKWIKESTTEHSRWKKLDIGYGFLWWLGKEGGFAAMGDGGNIIYVDPEKRLVVAIASLFKPRAKDRIEFIQKYVEPMFDNQR